MDALIPQLFQTHAVAVNQVVSGRHRFFLSVRAVSIVHWGGVLAKRRRLAVHAAMDSYGESGDATFF